MNQALGMRPAVTLHKLSHHAYSISMLAKVKYAQLAQGLLHSPVNVMLTVIPNLNCTYILVCHVLLKLVLRL